MAVDATSAAVPTSQLLTSEASEAKGSSPEDGASTRKIDPESEDGILDAAAEAFLPGMMASQLMMNSTLFNFSKEAIDEAEQQ